MRNDNILFNRSEITDKSPLDANTGRKGGVASALPYAHSGSHADDIRKLETLVEKSHKPLISLTSVFPFDIFPDTIVIDVNKVDVIHRTFFWSQEMYSMLIKNIIDVAVINNPFFASLEFRLVGFEANPPPIRYLLKSQAQKARRIIMGLVTCDKEGIDLTAFTDEHLIDQVEEIGTASVH